MIIHSTAATALFTAAYLMVQSAMNPGANTASATPEKDAPPGIQQAANEATPEAAAVEAAAPVVAANVVKLGREETKSAQTAKKQAQKKVIVIGRNTVSVKYVAGR